MDYARPKNSTGTALMADAGRLVVYNHLSKKCPVCRQRLTLSTDYRAQLSIDHVVPCVAGGHELDQDPLGLCRSCNSSKSGQELKPWLKSRLAKLGRRSNERTVEVLANELIGLAESTTQALAAEGLDKSGRPL